jgi:8-oxo-dGTP diphosphatase
MQNVIQVVSGWVFNADHTKVLVVDNIGGKWSMPGGAVEPDEYIHDAMIREAFEETGLHVRIKRLVAISEGFNTAKGHKVVFFGFHLEQTEPGQNPSIQMPDEIAEILWVDEHEFKEKLPWLQYSPWDRVKASDVGFFQSIIL